MLRRPVAEPPVVSLDLVCSSYYTLHMNSFGSYIRARREALNANDRSMSVRQVAQRIGVEPAFLSKIERDVAPPPSEAKIVALAEALGEDPDLLLAMANKVSSDLQEIIRKRPQLFAELLRQLKQQPDHAILKIVRQVSDGDW
jgi:HTH-type transcriptional regulator, competence development regulator